ncbi:uncharacterized protein PGRI_032780 [Penicillium griseofulvum]|uniref:Ribosomal RNA methyltransferase FtsJ domain-containing protein n=1 Tax=Penicillium patulum TaxID=5078 RepID=A0A135LKG4_PENPA|nr:uncharacterized protein PGRI_032780 [Penicillium griseofulvum]KXG49408.1 hypothetical protein PGRI_032780 [Penicillium griseofulvum]
MNDSSPEGKESGRSGNSPQPDLATAVPIYDHLLDERKFDYASKTIVPYLNKQSSEFRELSLLRKKGWENPKGDVYFRAQRRNADQSSEKNDIHFHNLMKKIGEELHQSSNAFKIQSRYKGGPTILDTCMAPGGFLETALKLNPHSRAVAFSLPASCGGHKIRLPRAFQVDVRHLDVTMLAADMGVNNVPQDHPDAHNFLPQQLGQGEAFDLVICDGQVLRTHLRAPYREKVEARRLTATQLVLGLQHLRNGGTMVVLLHKLEAWDTANLIWQFTRFASVKLIKPKTGHAKRSSFYLVAKDIQDNHPEAVRNLLKWKKIWRLATFGSEAECRKEILDDCLRVEDFIANFGPRLVELGREIWKVQADALAKAPFIK